MSIYRPTVSEFVASAYDPSLEKRFFSRILLPNGMFKTTDCRRLDDLNRAVLPFIEAINERPVEIMDVGASSGVGTQEWSDHLSSHSVEARVMGTDRFLTVGHLRCGTLEALFDEEAGVMHLAVFGRSLPARGRWYQEPVCAVLRVFISVAVRCGCEPKPVSLISKAVRNVTLVEDNIEKENEEYHGRFHVIRAANVLNAHYFTAARLKTITRILARRLRARGLLVVGRTHLDGSNHASILQVEAGRMKVAARLRTGSELEEVLLATDLSQRSPGTDTC